MDIDTKSNKRKRCVIEIDNLSKRVKSTNCSLFLQIVFIEGLNRELLSYLPVLEWIRLLPLIMRNFQPLISVLFQIVNQNPEQLFPVNEVQAFVDNYQYFLEVNAFFCSNHVNHLPLTFPSPFTNIDHYFAIGWMMEKITRLIDENRKFRLVFHINDRRRFIFKPKYQTDTDAWENGMVRIESKRENQDETIPKTQLVQLLNQSLLERHIRLDIFEPHLETINLFTTGFLYRCDYWEDDQFLLFENVSRVGTRFDFTCCKPVSNIVL